MTIPRLTAGLVAVCALGVSACVSVLPDPVTPIALIVLPSSRAQAPAMPLRADVNVFPPDASRALGGVDIPVSQDQELVYLPEVRWADASPRLLQGAVLDALSNAGGEGRAAPAQLGVRAPYDLRWRIVDLAVGRGGGVAICTVEAMLIESSTRRILAQQRFESVEQPSGRSPRERAAALALATQRTADAVASFVASEATPPAAR
ncbi:hypothetical protein GC169_08530 [bacterium]|nr:hypothetical protein [bacterium]